MPVTTSTGSNQLEMLSVRAYITWWISMRICRNKMAVKIFLYLLAVMNQLKKNTVKRSYYGNHSTSMRSKQWVFHSEELKDKFWTSLNIVTLLTSSPESFLLMYTTFWSSRSNKLLPQQGKESVEVWGFLYPLAFILAAPKTSSS